MSQFRQDNITKQWVLIAPKRALRPESFNMEAADSDPMQEVDHTCVFCPGNEHLTPDTILALPNEKKWKVRVVPNKFETLSHKLAKPLDGGMDDFYISRPGVGDHEVIIMREHSKPLALQEPADIVLAIRAWQARMFDLANHAEVRYTHIIENHEIGRASCRER